MKYIKARKDLIFIANLPIILASILLFCYFSREVVASFQAFWILTLCVLFLIVTPFGNRRLSPPQENNTQRLPLLLWFGRILLLELVMLGVYYGISLINSDILPINGLLQPPLFILSLHGELLQYGLFPWTIYALVSVGMGVAAYREQTDAYLSKLAQFFSQHNPHSAINLIIDIGPRRATLFALASTLLFTTLFFISFVLSPKIHISTGFHPNALLMTFTLLVITFSQTAKQYINRIFSSRVSKWISFPVFCGVLGVSILILSLLTSQVTQKSHSQIPPSLITSWMHFNTTTAWILFSTIWWICFTPLVCGFIARISKGYTIRTVLIGVLLFPLLISVFFLGIDHHYFSPIHISAIGAKILALISFFILLPLLVTNETTPNAIMSYFPKNGVIKHRDSQPFFQHVVQLAIALLYFYLVIGINGISLFMFAVNYFSMLVLFVTSLAITKHCLTLRK